MKKATRKLHTAVQSYVLDSIASRDIDLPPGEPFELAVYITVYRGVSEPPEMFSIGLSVEQE